jgi:RNA polymerase sigma-70 factor (ECF subfamily)
LSRQQNLSISEISEMLNIAPRTVKNQISNALKILRTGLDVFLVIIFLFIK